MSSTEWLIKKKSRSILGQLDEQLQVNLLKQSSIVQLAEHEHVFHMGQLATHFYWIKSGQINLYRPSYSGEEKIFRCLGAGETLAETVMFIKGGQYPLSAQAQDNVLLHAISKESLLTLCQRNPELTMRFLECMAISIMQSVNRIDLLTIGNAAQRLASYLLDLYIEERSAWFNLPVRQALLARQLNITPETFSRQLTQFRRAGFIGGRNSEIVLLDIDGLCASAGLPVPILDLQKPRSRSASLGSGLFECCGYFKKVLA